MKLSGLLGKRPVEVPASLLLFFFLPLYKSISLIGLRNGVFDGDAINFLFAELLFPTLVFLLFCLNSALHSGIFNIVLRAFLTVCLWWYCAEFYIALTFDYRLNFLAIPDIFLWASKDLKVIASFLGPAELWGLLFLIVSEFLVVRFQIHSTTICFVALFLLSGAPSFFSKSSYSRYRFAQWDTTVKSQYQGGERALYYPEDLVKYTEGADWSIPVIADRNIIVVLIESLSPVDVFRIGGVNNHFPKLEKVAEEGILYTNFYSNYESSEGALVSVFGGFPPLPYPGNSGRLSQDYKGSFTVANQYRAAGVYTSFLTTGPLSFLDKGTLLENLGFQLVRGNEEVERFKKGGIHVFNAPPDHILYESAVEHISEMDKPYLLTLETVTSHLPYRDPFKKSNDAATVLAYVDKALYEFHVALQQSGFYEDGLLVVLGDHRKMMKLTQQEKEQYGESATARTVLLVVGAGIPRGVVEESPLQQYDLFRHLGTLGSGRSVFSNHPFFVERFEKPFGNPLMRGHFKIFDGEKGAVVARGITRGDGIVWSLAPKNPKLLSSVKRTIHQTRARLQRELNTRDTVQQMTCAEAPLDLRDIPPSGWYRRIYEEDLLSAMLDTGSNNLVDMKVLPRLDYLHSFQKNDRVLDFQYPDRLVTQYVRSFFSTDKEAYSFTFSQKLPACLFIDEKLVLDTFRVANEAAAFAEVGLSKGEHRVEVRMQGVLSDPFDIFWRAKDAVQWMPLDAGRTNPS